MGFVFVKLNVGEIISSNGGLVFKKLTTTPTSNIEGPMIDLTALGLPAGKYTITVTANAIGLLESNESNAVTYTV